MEDSVSVPLTPFLEVSELQSFIHYSSWYHFGMEEGKIALSLWYLLIGNKLEELEKELFC